jgi:gamma-glutamyl phosphate reductase
MLQDVAEAQGKISDSLMQRLMLKPQKIQQLAAGIRAIAAEEEPIRRVLQRTEVAEGQQRTVHAVSPLPVLRSLRACELGYSCCSDF